MKDILHSNYSLVLSEIQLKQLETYADLLIEANKKTNLISQNDKAEVYSEHIIDTLSFNLIQLKDYFSCLDNLKLCDIGSGGGFPVIPISILYPEMHICAIESVGKKVNFLESVSSSLNIQYFKSLNDRIEVIAQNSLYRESFDIVTARALSNIFTLVEYALPLLSSGGIFVAYKTEKVKEDFKALKNTLSLLGGEIADVVDYEIIGKDLKRTLVIFKKVSITPEKYPRKVGTPLKKPLK